MSGSIMGGFGVDDKIPLAAGQGVAQTNPLQSVGTLANTINAINQTKLFPGQLALQGQAVKGGAATLGQHLNQVGANAMLPAVLDPNLTMAGLTHYAAGAEGVAGGTTQGILGQVASLGFAPDTPEWRTAVKQIITSQAQVSPEAGAAQVAGIPHEQQTANGVVSGTTAPAVAGGGFTPAVTTPMGIAPARAVRPATADDVSRDPSLTIGQPIQTVLPGASGGAAAPSGGSLGPGGYRAPQRPLSQLGAPYAPPGGGAPAGAAPGAAPGSIVMRGPKGTFMVPPDKVQAFKAAGYQ